MVVIVVVVVVVIVLMIVAVVMAMVVVVVVIVSMTMIMAIALRLVVRVWSSCARVPSTARRAQGAQGWERRERRRCMGMRMPMGVIVRVSV